MVLTSSTLELVVASDIVVYFRKGIRNVYKQFSEF